MLTDVKELKKFFKLCREYGVAEISFDGVTAKFGDLPVNSVSQTDEEPEIPTDSLTPEQLMFYAVGDVGQP